MSGGNIIVTHPVYYRINSLSIGDMIVAAMVVKWAIDHYHKDGRYVVYIVADEFKPLFSFVPPDHLFVGKSEPPSSTRSWCTRYFNAPKRRGVARITSMRMSLAQYASIQLTGRLLPFDRLSYLPIPEVPIDHYGINFSRAVLITTTHRASNRQWPQATVQEIANFVAQQGYTPVYIGKVSDDPLWGDLKLKATFDTVPSPGIDLRNKTSISELASIARHAKAIVGVDSGPIHVAGTTSIPIVCGYTSVSPAGLIPLRKEGITYAVVPTVDCRFCQTNWQLDWHDFATCHLGHYQCVKEMTADKFIAYLKLILE